MASTASQAILSLALPAALAIVMLGLGLSLKTSAFASVLRRPGAVAAALAAQLLVLPAVCLGLIVVFQLPPTLAVGMMLLAASPGGPTASIFSRLFGGDVAWNVSLTAVNSLICIVTIPLIVNLSISWFNPGQTTLNAQSSGFVQILAVVLVPVAVGMLIGRASPLFAQRMRRPVTIASAVAIVLALGAAIAANFELLVNNFGSLALIAVLFCVISLTLGFTVARLLRLSAATALASGFEVGLHNATFAIVVAQTVLGSAQLSLPAAVYGVLMIILGLAFGLAVRRIRLSRRPSAPSALAM